MPLPTKEQVLSWIQGLVATAISAAAGSVGAVIVAPETFNLNEGLSKLGQMALVFAIIAVANYLKQSPLPGKE